jgi:hypothetical protein
MRQTHKLSRLITLCGLLTMVNVGAFSQSSGGNFKIANYVVAGGGCGPNGSGGCGPSSGSGNLSLHGTVAEPGAADLSRQSPYSSRSGFWNTSLGSAPTAANGNIGGRIVDSNGNPVAGASIRLSGTQNRLTVSDVQGNYHFNNVETNGFYTVTPARANFDFNPSQRSFSQLGQHTEAAFSAISTGDGLNPLDTTEYFVRQHYLDFLNREPDEAGFNFWVNNLERCGNDSQCRTATRLNISAAFFISIEFQQSGSFIYDLYVGTLGRKPVFAEYSSDRQQVVGGANLDAAKTVFAQSFAQRAEFASKYQNATTAESFVDALIRSVQVSGVDLGSEREDLINTYNSGIDTLASRAAVVRTVADNPAFKQSQYNAAFVLTEYFGYLRRNPDQAGYDFWLNVLNYGDRGNYRGTVCAFITSTEYQKRFSTVVSHGNGECGQ